VFEAKYRHLDHSEHPGCLDPAMSGDDGILAVDKDRIGKPEALDTIGNLFQLFLGMCARIPVMRDQVG